MNVARSTALITLLLIPATAIVASAAEVKLGGHTFQLPDGFTIQQIAAPPLVQRPIHMSFDVDGVLYVTDSSGNTDKAPVQLNDPQHRVLRLIDRDGDGVFDESTVFADKLPFPEGILVYDDAVLSFRRGRKNHNKNECRSNSHQSAERTNETNPPDPHHRAHAGGSNRFNDGGRQSVGATDPQAATAGRSEWRRQVVRGGGSGSA